MKSYAKPAALLSLLLVAGCADRGDTKVEDGRTAATEPAADSAAPNRDAARDDAAAPRDGAAEGARPTTGARSARPTRPDSATTRARSDAAPQSARDTDTAGSEAPRASATNAAPARRAVEWREVTIPEGTALPLELETALSSETAQVETPVRAKLTQAVVVNGVTALPAGAVVSGNVTNVERAGRVKGRASLAFSFNQVRADNMTAAIRTAPLSYVGEASKGEDATKIGAGAGVGAIVGGIVGGGDGAAKGAAIGGAAGTGVVLATRGKEVQLASGTNLAATLAGPVTVRVTAR